MDERWLKTFLVQQNNRSKVLGDIDSPLISKVKKNEKRLRKEFEGRKTENDAFSKIFSIETASKSDKHESAKEKDSTQEIPQYLKNYQTSKKKKKKGKKKKKQKAVLNILSENLIEADAKNSNLMAELVKASQDVVLVDDDLWVYDEEFGCYRLSNSNEVAKLLHSSLSYDDKMKISSREYKESFELLKISDDILCVDGFAANIPFVNCLNGVVDVCGNKLFEHSSNYLFKHCIQANFDPKARCDKFLEYVEYITGGNKDLKKLLRSMLGYIMSSYNNAKVAFLIHGVPHTGKSVLCNLVERVIGKEYVSHVDLSMLQRQEYVASLTGKLLNIAPDLKNEALKDVGFFKSLVSHDDKIAARALYGNPKEIKCETKMLFSTNHLLTFDSSLGLYDIEAVFNRFVYFPYQNKPITDSVDNKHLSDELYEECDGIFTWAIKGLRDYIENNECFPECQLSSEIKLRNMAKYCPEKIFFEKCIKKAEGLYESSSAIKEAFEAFCKDCEVKHKGNISSFLEEHERLSKTKKRIDEKGRPISSGNPIYVYEGIRLRNKYRV